MPRFAVDGFEADDVIATLATQAEAVGFDVLIVTGDRDSFQLVSEHTTVLYPTKGVSELTRFTPEKVEEKYGLAPQQYPDFAALRGDPSDNLPGIPGVGEKTAAKWITQFGSFAELVERADEVKGKAGQNFRDHLEAVKLNRVLTEMVKDVELPRAPADLARVAVRPDRRDRCARRAGDPQRLAARAAARRGPGRGRGSRPRLRRGRCRSWTASVLGTGELAPWLEAHAGGPLGIATVDSWALGQGSVSEIALAAARRRRRLVRRRPRWTRPTSGPSRPGPPTRPGPRSCTTPRA